MEHKDKEIQEVKDLLLKHQQALLDVSKTYSELLNYLINNELIDFNKRGLIRFRNSTHARARVSRARVRV